MLCCINGVSVRVIVTVFHPLGQGHPTALIKFNFGLFCFVLIYVLLDCFVVWFGVLFLFLKVFLKIK